jgi:molybdopterin-binding protein
MRNRLPGIVTRVLKDRVAAQVEIQAGPHRMVCLLTREAVDALGLVPGMLAIATVKATNVAVELPQAPRSVRRTS